MTPRITQSGSIHLHSLSVVGFVAENTPAEQKYALVAIGDAITSDHPRFYQYMKSINALITEHAERAGIHVQLDRVSAFVLVVHADDSADLYLQDFPMQMEILAKRDFAAGEIVYHSGVADVRRVRLPGISLAESDGVIVCFKVGWKFGLFFDLGKDRKLDVEGMEKKLGALYRGLSFEEAYAALGDPELFAQLVSAGWFPFVEIVGGDFDALLNAHRQSFNVDGEEKVLLAKFDAKRIDEMARRWWAHPALKDRRKILEPALEAFKRGDSVSCIKIILTEMEGIIRDARIAELGTGASIKDLLKYAVERGAKKTGDESSLFFPKEFLQYLSDCTYAHFDPNAPKESTASRHSVGHGGATADAYSPERALQAILTLDQLVFYL